MDKCQGCVVLPIIFRIACFLLAGGILVHILYLCVQTIFLRVWNTLKYLAFMDYWIMHWSMAFGNTAKC